MQCPACQHDNPAQATRCHDCHAPLLSDATVTSMDPNESTNTELAANPNATVTVTTADAREPANPAPSAWASQPAAPERALAMGELTAGSVLGGRYEIIKMLGEGGMGAVYKARDREVDRFVALKVIRPELANRTEILKRFKQELILARQITHKNVIRIFDLGQADGIKFITMEFVEGQDLHGLLEENHPFTLEQKVKIIIQVCLALDAAHAEEVVHRDLKPHNIMIENTGRVVVMDFGIARSMEQHGMTSTGALIGTPAYMSPEQAKGEKLDTRSDLFSLGVVFYELLTGKAPYEADTLMGLLVKRVQERPIPPIDRNPEVPQALSDIVMKSLAVDREHRYQSATAIAKDLEGWLGAPSTFRTIFDLPPPPVIPSATELEAKLAYERERRLGKLTEGRTIVTPGMRMMEESSAWKWITLSLAVVLVIGAAVYGVNRYWNRPAAPVAPMTVIIADFNNHTGDPVFSGTLEATLKLAMQGASFISAYDRTQMRALGVPAISGTLDESKAKAIAASQGLNVVVSGSLDRRGADYHLSLRAVHTVTGKVLANADETAPTKDQVLFAVTKLGTTVRRALGDSTSESAQRLSMETLSAVSIEAVHEYAAGMDALSDGKFEEAQKRSSKAVDLDPNFGMAYTIIASAARNLGRLQDAEKYAREAIKHIDHMTERERYRTRAFLYYMTGDQQKCVDEYGALLERYPSDTGAYANISACFLHLRNIPKALEAARRAVAILPRRAIYHGNLAYYLAFNGDFQTAAKEAAETLKLGYATGLLFQAYASLGQGQVPEAAEAYRKFEKTNPSDATTGLADLAVYEGRFKDAVSILEKGAVADMVPRRPNPDSASTKLWMLAYVQLLRGEKGPALAAAKRALDLSNAVRTRFVAARVYVALGETAKAKELAAGLSSELQIEPQAYAKVIEGEAALQSGDGRGAINLFNQANDLLDTWIGRFDLGRAYLEIGAFPQADSEFDRCLKRRGEALALFLDLPTYGYFPPVYYYQGRVREGMKSPGFAESYRKYLGIRGKAAEDPLLAEVRRKVGQ